jgi:hypothetical protein
VQALEDAINSIEHPSIDLTNYVTKEELNVVEEKIPQPELFVVDYDSPDFIKAYEAYSQGKLLVLTNAAPDIHSYAIMNYARNDLITFTKFLMSRSEAYGAFNTYYLHSDNTWEVAKEVILNKVEASYEADGTSISTITIGKETYSFDNFATTQDLSNIDKSIENIENTYVSNELLENNYITKQEIANTYVTEEYVTNNYVTNEAVTEIVETQVDQVVTEEIQITVENVVQNKIETGEIVVKTDSISYDSF